VWVDLWLHKWWRWLWYRVNAHRTWNHNKHDCMRIRIYSIKNYFRNRWILAQIKQVWNFVALHIFLLMLQNLRRNINTLTRIAWLYWKDIQVKTNLIWQRFSKKHIFILISSLYQSLQNVHCVGPIHWLDFFSTFKYSQSNFETWKKRPPWIF